MKVLRLEELFFFWVPILLQPLVWLVCRLTEEKITEEVACGRNAIMEKARLIERFESTVGQLAVVE